MFYAIFFSIEVLGRHQFPKLHVHTLVLSPSWILLYIQADQDDEQHRTNNKKTNFITVYMYMYIWIFWKLLLKYQILYIDYLKIYNI